MMQVGDSDCGPEGPGVRVPSVTLRAVRVTPIAMQLGSRPGSFRASRAQSRPWTRLPPSCRRVRSLDVEDGGTNAADSDDDAFASFSRDRLSVDQVRGDVDQVTLPDRDQLNAPGPNSTVIAPPVM
jgi:hypothetical protein